MPITILHNIVNIFILLLVYQRKFAHENNYTIQCYLGRTIKIIWVNYDSTKTTCVSTKATQLMQGKCDGKTTCTFYIRKPDLGSCSGDSNEFLVRYTCKVDAKPGKLKVSWWIWDGWSGGQSVHKTIPILFFLFLAAPSALHVSARGQKKMFVGWSNNANRKYNIMIKFEVCFWQSHSTIPGVCSTVSSSQSSLTLTLTLDGLKPATKYNVTVARYSCDGSILGIERREIAITRSG